MNTIFIGGSRHISRLPPEIKKRIDNVVASGHHVIVGDANGADKAVQKHLLDSHYDKVTVFCSGVKPRNNLGVWSVRRVEPPKGTKGFQYYAAKDREMAREADFGLMVWDGKSPGTVLNVLRLAQTGKISVLFNAPEKAVINIKSIDQLRAFFSRCSSELHADIKERATQEEWASVENVLQANLLTVLDAASKSPALKDAVAVLNQALASGDATKTVETVGTIARHCGMSQVARDTGLARESLYRSLDAAGNPEFATIMKVLSSIGLRLEAKMVEPSSDRSSVDNNGGRTANVS